MPAEGPRGCTRRAVLTGLPALSFRPLGKGTRFRSPQFRYIDRSTEFPVLRLTDPAYPSGLPAPWARAVARRGGFLLCWMERTGSRQAFRLEPQSGAATQLTEADALDPGSLNLLPDERACVFFDGPSLRLLELPRLKERELHRVPPGFERGPGFSISEDGSHAAWIEVRDGVSYLRRMPLRRGEPATLLAAPAPLADPLLRPAADALLYRRESGLWVDNRRLALAPGRPGPAFWTPDGARVLYLNFPADTRELISIHEADPQSGADLLIARTSQYAAFALNEDASVFAGASLNRASPFLLLMLRLTRRELPLCEHRASDPARVAPIFSPDSQRLYFNSDAGGSPAIYCLAIDRLVARTD